ncbi:MAG: NAD-dependent dihydropyrimidine dehydrogenase subunit PreA [Firmicutes bacterium ADurb.Bin506]|nr:MAG: NAD-dependent dihydropyrimidine dehydrogenase subunit PreA [Firmicutes bacterium ADurb.Bin506]
MSKTSIEFAGLTLKNPFVVASGPVTSSLRKLKECEANGAGAVSVKLILKKQPWNAQLRMYSVPGEVSIVCHDRRLDEEVGLELLTQAREHTNLIIFANMGHMGEDLEGWQQLALDIEKAGAHALELNLICPNLTFSAMRMGAKVTSSYGAAAGQNPEACYNIVKALKEVVHIPVVPKLTPNVGNISETAKACEEAGADGICLAGGQSSLPRVDLENGGKPLTPFLDGVSFGSLGGPVALTQSFALVAQAARTVKIPIIGGGGIATWQDAIMFMMWGARLATACTEPMWRGFGVIKQITDGMCKYIEDHGYSSFEDIIGLSLPYLRFSKELKPDQVEAKIDYDTCVRCMSCVGLGHCDAIVERDGEPFVNTAECVGCGICVDICPVKAISMVAK